MKTTILFLLILITSTSFAQIGTVKTHETSTEVGRLYGGKHLLVYYDATDGKRQYVLSFWNEEYVHVEDVKRLTFTATQEDFDYFYNFLRDGFGSNQVRSLEVGNAEIMTYPDNLGYMDVGVNFKDGTSGKLIFSKRQLDKLFGKR